MLLATLAISLAPLLLQLPGTVALAVIATALLMSLAGWRRPLPGAIKLSIAALAVAAVMTAFDFRMGRDTGCALLAAMLAVKPAETRSLRDARSLVGFSLFAPFSTFLLDQGPVSMLLALLSLVAALATLQRLADVESGIEAGTLREHLPRVGKLLALGLPLTMAAFWLFPRIGSPLWGVPDRAAARARLSDSISPGDWLELMTDDRTALRVRFFGPPPARESLYWRGPVLWDFDGRTWSGAAPANATMPTTETAGGGWDYELEAEPSEQRYLTALDLPDSVPDGAIRTPDGNLLARQSLQSVTRWRLRSIPAARFQTTLPAFERRRALALPFAINPRARQLAMQWRAQTGGNPVAIVGRAISMVNAELAYSLAAPPLGRDTVDDFLFVTKTGYCEHFSSSFVFLMRAAGVPARVVTGFAGGYLNPVGDYWIVRNSDAHAWAEVWLAGRGWVRVDPTAAVAPECIFDTLADRLPGRIGGFEGLAGLWNAADWMRRGWNDFVLGFDAQRQSRLLRWLGVQRLDGGSLVALLVLATVLALGWMLWWLSRGERERDPLLRAWHGLSARYRRHGLARAPSEAAGDWVARVGLARPAEKARLESLATRFGEARYAASDERDALIRDIRRFRPGRDAC